ncbi:putative adhesin [Yersinia enterocolitica]
MILTWKTSQHCELYRESRFQGGYIRNYNISKYAADTYEFVRNIANRYGVDVLTVRNRMEREIYPVDLGSLFKIMKINNISYKFIDAIYCRSRWLSWRSMPQCAYRI